MWIRLSCLFFLTVAFLQPSISQHPRLLFTSGDVSVIRGKYQPSGFPFSDLYDELNHSKWFEEPSGDDQAGADRKRAQFAKVWAFRYLMTQNPSDGDKAFGYLSAIVNDSYVLDARFDRWMTNGLALIDYCIAFDILAGASYPSANGWAIGGECSTEMGLLICQTREKLKARVEALYNRVNKDRTVSQFLGEYISWERQCKTILEISEFGIRWTACYNVPVTHPDVYEEALFHSGIGNIRIIVAAALGVAAHNQIADATTSQPWLERAEKDIEHFLINRKRYPDIGSNNVQSQNVDGAFPEGIEYLNYAAEGFVPFFVANKLNGREDYAQDANFKKILDWCYDVQLPTGAAPQLNSSGNSGVYPLSSLFASTVTGGNNYLWQLERFKQSTGGTIGLPVEGFCMINSPPPPSPKLLSISTVLSTQGQAIYRDVPSSPQKYLLLSAKNDRARYDAGLHGHAEAGSYIFTEGSNVLVRHPGYSGYESSERYEKAVSHSVICPIVNGEIPDSGDGTSRKVGLPPSADARFGKTKNTTEFNYTNVEFELNRANQYADLATFSLAVVYAATLNDATFEYVGSKWLGSGANEIEYGTGSRQFLMVNNSYLIIRDEVARTSPSLQYAVSFIQGNNGDNSEETWRTDAGSTGNGDEVYWKNGSGPILRANTSALGGKVSQFSGFDRAVHQNQTTRDLAYHAKLKTAFSFNSDYGQTLSILESDQSLSVKSSMVTKRNSDSDDFLLYTVDGRGKPYGRYDVVFSQKDARMRTIFINDLPNPIVIDATFFVMSYSNNLNDINAIKLFSDHATLFSYQGSIFMPTESGEAQTSFNIRPVPSSNSSLATAFSNSRKSVRRGDNIYLVYEDAGAIWYSSSADNGATWSTAVPISGLADATHSYRNPAIAVEDVDNIHVVWEELSNGSSRRVLYRWNPAGAGWSTTKDISTSQWEATYSEDQTPSIMVAATYIGVAWRSNGKIIICVNPSFDDANKVTEVLPGTLSGGASFPTIESAGGVASVAWEQTSTIWCKSFQVIPNGSGVLISWGSTERVSPTTYLTNYAPSLTLVNDVPAVAWRGENTIGQPTSIHFRKRESVSGDEWQGTIRSYSYSYATAVYPSVSGIVGTTKVSIVWSDNGEVTGATFDGVTWSAATVLGSGSNGGTYPNLSINQGTIHSVWRKPDGGIVISTTGVNPADPPPPSAPIATGPTNITSSGFTANWSSVTGATGYRLDVATDNGFSSLVSGYADLDVGNVTSKPVAGLNAGTAYHYRVRAYNVGGTSTNSNTVDITTMIHMNLTTNPAGLSVIVDGQGYTAPAAFDWVLGSGHTITAPNPQSGGEGVQYVWTGWSDNGAWSHNVAPTASGTYTATFSTEYLLTTNGGSCGLSVSGGGWYPSGTNVSVSVTSPQSGGTGIQYVFTEWSGASTAATATVNIIMDGPKSITAGCKTQYQLTMVAGGGGTVSPSTGWYDSGDNVQISASPSSCYSFNNWSGSGSGSFSGPDNPRGIIMNGPITETANFTAQGPYTLSVSVSGSGSVTKSPDKSNYNCGEQVTLTANPTVCSSFSGWSGSVGGTASPVTITMDGNKSVTANFNASGATYTITPSAGSGGSISPSTPVSVSCGGNQTFTIAPTNSCYRIASVIVDGISQGAITSYTFSNVTSNHTISASFFAPGYVIDASAGSGGSIYPSGLLEVSCGSSKTFTITPAAGYNISNVFVNGLSVGITSTYTFGNITSDQTISATFTPCSQLGPPQWVTASLEFADRIELAWDFLSGDCRGSHFNIYRRPAGGGTFEWIVSVSYLNTNGWFYTDYPPPIIDIFEYYITTVDELGRESAPSQTVAGMWGMGY